MRWIVPVLVASLGTAACGGPDVPTHNGYRSEKATPWKKPKTLSWNEKFEAKAEDDLSYPDQRRAKWYSVDLPRTGELALRLEVLPPDQASEDFDIGFEILDDGFRSLYKSDLEDDEAGETTKLKTFSELPGGRYLIHLYLQGRMDVGEFTLRAAFKAAPTAEVKSDFPSQVAFLDPLPVVPTTDDTPKGAIVKTPPPPTGKKPKTPKGPGTPPPPPPPTTNTTVTARVMGSSVSGGKTVITVGRGTDTGASDGMKAKVKGIPGTYSLYGCNARACKATVDATPDQIKAAGNSVTITP